MNLAFNNGQCYEIHAKNIEDLWSVVEHGFTIHARPLHPSQGEEYGRKLSLTELRELGKQVRETNGYGERCTVFNAPYLLLNGELAGVIFPPMSNTNGSYGQYSIGLSWEDGDFVKPLPVGAVKLIELVKTHL
ncbi:MAG: hypothetical protein JXR84_04375 [Anaerolineae bacterium]|nr:hypothetical protein [Anaerolineae bacterium]